MSQDSDYQTITLAKIQDDASEGSLLEARLIYWRQQLVHIETDNGVWRIDAAGYTYAGREDAWVLPFEQAVQKVSHCGPEKKARFIRVRSMNVAEQDGWTWWAGSNDEHYHSGPHKTREEAIEAGQANWPGETIHIIEARQQRVTFRADRLIDEQYFECEDYFSVENGDDPDRCEGHVLADEELQSMLDNWATKYQHTFVQPTLFGATRNRECIPGEGEEA